MDTNENLPVVLPRYEKESFVCNATSGAILLFLLFQIIITLGVSTVGTLVFGIIQNSAFAINTYFLTTITNVSNVVSTIGGMGLSVLMVKNILKIKLPSVQNPHCGVKRILYFTFVAMGVSGIISFIVQIINTMLMSTGVQMTTPDFTMRFDTLNNVLLLISTCIVAPIFEELLFRGLILTALKRFGHVYAIVVTSLLFALIHGNIPQSVPTFFFSIILCYVVLRTKSLFPAIMIHFINNSIGILELYTSGNSIISSILSLFEIAVMIFAVYAILKKRALIKPYIEKHKGSRIRSYFKHIAPIIVLIFCLFSILISFSFS